MIKAGEAVQGARRRLRLEPRDGRVQQDDGLCSHGDLLFVFNWHPTASIPDYELPVQAPGKYVPLLSTDERRFGGQQRQAMDAEHFSFPARDGDNTERPHIRIYNTSRTATVYLRNRRTTAASAATGEVNPSGDDRTDGRASNSTEQAARASGRDNPEPERRGQAPGRGNRGIRRKGRAFGPQTHSV